MDNDTNQLIDDLLDMHRPERYATGDRLWRAPVYADIEQRVTISEARRVAARQMVDQREGAATRQANDLLREIGRTQQWPLAWLDVARHPIAVDEQRIRLDVATAKDFREWELDERRRAANEFTARNAACDGARWVADQLDVNGWLTFADGAAANQTEQAS